MKKFLVFAALSLAVSGCSHNSPTGPSAFPSAGGTLPSWMFGQAGDSRLAGHLVRPADGICTVAFGIGISGDAEVATHVEQSLEITSAMTGGAIRFVRTDSKGATMTILIDPSASLEEGVAGNTMAISTESFMPLSSRIIFKSREVALSNTSLHEIGHFVFCGGHSDGPGDIMNANRVDRTRMSFSAHESQVWAKAHAFPPGTTP
jgi:hypothetical protein